MPYLLVLNGGSSRSGPDVSVPNVEKKVGGVGAGLKEKNIWNKYNMVRHNLCILAMFRGSEMFVDTPCVTSWVRWGSGFHLDRWFRERTFICWWIPCDCGGWVMSCLWASRSVSVFVTLSLYHTERSINTNLYLLPTLFTPYPTLKHTHNREVQKFLPISKHFHSEE